MTGEILTSLNIELGLKQDKLDRGLEKSKKSLDEFNKTVEKTNENIEKTNRLIGEEFNGAIKNVSNSQQVFNSLENRIKKVKTAIKQSGEEVQKALSLDNRQAIVNSQALVKNLTNLNAQSNGAKELELWRDTIKASAKSEKIATKFKDYLGQRKNWVEILISTKPIEDALRLKKKQLDHLKKELSKAKIANPKGDNVNLLTGQIQKLAKEINDDYKRFQSSFKNLPVYRLAKEWRKELAQLGFDPVASQLNINKLREKYATTGDRRYKDKLDRAELLHNTLLETHSYATVSNNKALAEREKAQKGITEELQRQGDLGKKNLALSLKEVETNKKKLEQLRRQRYYAQHDIWLATAGFGGAYFGANVARSIIDRSAKYQTISAQQEAWAGLTPLQKSEFDIVADYTMNKNPMMSRTEAKDATMAGMSSLGHWDFDILKTLIPVVSSYAQGSRSLGYSNDTVANIIKNYLGVAEARQQTTEPDAMLRTFETLWKIENVTGGKVTVKDFETILRNLGPGASLISDEGLLNLVAFAEQIKVAGHGGGGGAGAGISTVGNLVKMLQLMASGKPTSLWSKQMLELLELDNGNDLLDIKKAFNGKGKGGLSVELSALYGIIQSEFGQKNGNRGLMGAGFSFKNKMWTDPVGAINDTRNAILRYTLEKENRSIYYDEDVDFNNLTEKDKKKAVNTFIARAGFSHRTGTAWSTWVDPAFQERRKHTVASTGLIDDPMSLMDKQRLKGNWNVAIKDLDASFQRLAESMTPVVEDLAKIVEGFSAFLKKVADFNEQSPLFTRINALALGLITMAPGLGFFAMGIEGICSAFKRLAEAKAGIEELENLQGKGAVTTESSSNKTTPTIINKDGVAIKSRRLKGNPNATTSSEVETQQPQPKKQTVLGNVGSTVVTSFQTAGKAVDKFNSKLGSIVGVARTVVSRVGSFFLKLIPGIGTALLAFDLGTIMLNWVAQIEVGGRSMIDRLRGYAQKAKLVANVEKEAGLSDKYVRSTNKEFLNKYYADGEVYTPTNDRATTLEMLKKYQKSGILAYKDTFASLDDGGQEILQVLTDAVFYFGKNIEITNENLPEVIKAIEKNEAKREKDANKLELLKKVFESTGKDIAKINQEKTSLGTNLFDASRNVVTSTKFKEDERKTEKQKIDEAIKSLSTSSKENMVAFFSLLKDESEQEVAFWKEKFTSDTFISQVKEILKTSGNTLIAQDYEFIKNLLAELFDKSVELVRAGKGENVQSLPSAVNAKLTDPQNKKHENQVIPKGSKTAEALFPKNSGNSFMSVHPAHQYWSDLTAQLDEADASAEGLMRGTGKRDIEWAKAEILKKWQKGGFAPSKMTPDKSPWMKTKKGGLKDDNMLWDKKDAFGRTAMDYASKLQEAEVAKIATQAVQSMAQSYEEGMSTYEQSMEFVNSSRLEEIPSSIQSLNNTLAKALGNIGFGSEKNEKQILAQREKVTKASAYAGIGVVAGDIGNKASENKKLREELKDSFIKERLSTADQALYDHQKALQKLNETYDVYIEKLQEARKVAEAEGNTEKLEKIAQQEESVNQRRLEAQRNLNDQFNLQNKTAGEELVQQWTDLTKMLDDMQTQAMEGFISATEDWLDGNIDSWREYAYNLGRLFRNQILKAGFAPLLEQMTGFMRLGVSTFAGSQGNIQNDKDALARQQPSSFFGINIKGLADGIFSTVKGWLTNKPSESSPSTSSLPSSDKQEIEQLTEEAKTEVANSTTELGSFWGSFKNVLTNVGNSLSSLGNSFMEFISHPLQSLSNAFVNTCSYLGNAVVSLFASLGGSGKTSYLQTFLGGALGGFISGVGDVVGGMFKGSESKTPNGIDQGNGVVTYPIPTHANGGIMTSNGEIDLAKYARGGIANSPQLAIFGEGSTPEAYVPLPDGRSIPVTINQGSGIGGASGVTNNIVINVSATSSGGFGEQQNTSLDNSESADFTQKLGQRIKAVVVQEIAQQSRPGGLLYQSK